MTKTDLRFLDVLRADMRAMEMDSVGIGAMFGAFFTRLDFPAVFLFRLSTACHAKGKIGRLFAAVLWRLNAFCNACDLRPQAVIGPGFNLPHPMGVVIGPVQIGCQVTIHQNVTLGRGQMNEDYKGPSSRPQLGDHVVIYAGAVIAGGVKIGDGAHIGANAVVVSDIPAGASAFAPPTRFMAP